jgi:hypothetical protein
MLRLALCTLALVLPLRPARGAAQAAGRDSTPVARTSVAPLPILYYTSETRMAVGAALNIFHRAEANRAGTRPSTVSPIFIYTFENQVLASLRGGHYWDADRNLLSAGLNYIKYPSSFYAIGNDNEADASEDYTTETHGFSLEYLREFWPRLRLGAGAVYGRSTLTEKEAGGLLDGGGVPGSKGGSIFGLGVMASRDSRDNITYPTGGDLYQLSAYAFDAALGSDFDYRTLTVEARSYRSLGARRILALRSLAAFTHGIVPFQVLPSLGGEALLRGYFGGRFRDRQLAALEGELRWSLWRRLGLVAFGGLGQVAPDVQGFALDAFHGAAGVGLRFLFIRAEGLNIRLDVGWGADDSGTYISLGEAY